MSPFKPKNILQVNPKLNFPGGEHFARFLMQLLQFNKLNRVVNKIGDKKGCDFVDELLKILSIPYDFDHVAFAKNTPATGSCIVISNQPFGGIESILLIKILSENRSDIKILTTNLFQKIEPISYFFLDNNLSGKRNDIEDQDKAVEHLAKGGLLCLFPAGMVSYLDNTRILSDKQWQFSTLKFIKQQKVPVLPVHFNGNNSKLFYLLERMNSVLGELKLQTEILYQKKKPVKIRVGHLISVDEQNQFQDVYQYGRYLRARTYCLGSNIEVKKFFKYTLRRSQKIELIADKMPEDLIGSEIELLGSEHLLFKLKNYHIYCAPSKRIPTILQEIGRLREITFRQVGEGTNRSIDLDEFDLYYNQLFIWDNTAQQIVGAYRIGRGNEILYRYGIRGFYVHTLFKIKDDLQNIFNETLELGRSFIVKEYQRKPLPLYLLWKGILYFTLKNPEYRYLIGPVSISDKYSTISKEMIIKYIMAHHYNWKLAGNIKPRKPYQFKSKDMSINVLMETMPNDINSLDKMIGDIEEFNTGIPILLKKYINLNAKIIGFNVDPKFNNSLDGLIILDMFNLPQDTVELLSKETNDVSILQDYYARQELKD